MSGDQLKLQLTAEMDAEPVKPGVTAIKQQLNSLADTGEQASNRLAKGLKRVGDQAEEEAIKASRVAKSFANAFIRAQGDIAAAATGRASDKLKFQATAKNVFDTAEVQKQYQILRQMEDAQRAVSTGMNNMGLSAKQLQASMRGLPAQFTDIFVSLSSGQAPMMVLMQQGGQIKDMFGGLVPALKAVASGVMSMIGPWTLAAAAIGAFALAYKQGADEQQEFRNQLILTGNQVGTTDQALSRMAKSISEMGRGISQGAAAEALTEFVKAGATGAETLERFAASSAAMAEAGGPKVAEMAKIFADLAKDPLKATLKLNESMNYLTLSTYDQIRASVELGDKATAVKVAQNAVADALDDRTPKMVQNLGLIERGWKAIKDGAEDAWNSMKEIGRQQDEMATVQRKLNDERARLRLAETPGTMWYNPATAADARDRIALLEADLQGRRDRAKAEAEVAAQARETALAVEAATRFDQQGLKFLADDLKLQKEINQAVIDGVAAHKTVEEIVKRINDLREDYAKKHKTKGPSGAENDVWVAKEYIAAWTEFQKIGDKAIGVTDDLSKSQMVLYQIVTSPAWVKMDEVWKNNIFDWYNAAQAMEEVADAAKEFDKVWKKFGADSDKQLTTFEDETNKIKEGTKALRLKSAQLGLNAQAQRELNIAQREAEIIRLEAAARSEGEEGSLRDQEATLRRIKELKDRNQAEREAGIAEEADDARKEWEKTAQSIENALTDALMRGFESGKDFAQNLVDTIKNGLKTFVAKVIINPIMGGLTNMVGSALGIPGAPGVGANGSFLGSMLGSYAGTAGAAGMFGSAGAYGLLTGTSGAQAAQLAAQTGMFGAEGLSLTASAGGTALGGAGSALLTAAPYLAAAYLGYSIWQNNKKNHQPAYQNYSQIGPADLYSWAPNIQNRNAYDDVLRPIVEGVSAAAKQLGGTGAESFTYGLYSSASPNGRGAQSVANLIGPSGQTLYNYNVNGSNESLDQRLKEQIPRLFFAALQESDMSKAFNDFFDQFDAASMTQEHLDTLLEVSSAAQQMAEAFKQLDGPFAQLASLSVEVRAGILDMVGGLDQFMQKTSGYFNDFYTEEERQAFALASVDKTLTGVGLNPDDLRTKEDYRAMLEKIDTSTPEGQAQYAAMINAAGAFSFGSGLLGTTGHTLGEITAGAPDSAGVDLMITQQTTTNSLLERIEAAIRETGAATAARPIVVDVTVDQPATVEVFSGGAQDGGGG
jgi:phage-related minor tail protein